MAKEFSEMSPNRFTHDRRNAVTEGERAKTFIERNAVYKGESSEHTHPIYVWYLTGDMSWTPEDNADALAPYKQAAEGYNQQTEDDERLIQITGLDLKDFQYAVKSEYYPGRYSPSNPTLVVLDRSTDDRDYSIPKERDPITNAYLQHYLQPIDSIRTAAHDYFRYMRNNGLPDDIWGKNDQIDMALVDHIFTPPPLMPAPELTIDDAVENAFYALVDDPEYRELTAAARQYIEHNDFSAIETFLSDERLVAAKSFAQQYDLETIEDEYVHFDGTQRRAVNDFSMEQRIAYEERVAELCDQIDINVLREYAKEKLRTGIDSGIREEILFDEDWDRWTERIIQPVIASVSPNIVFQRHALEHGANAIPAELSPKDMQRLAAMGAKSKDDWQSMATERTQRFKRQFYERHQAELEERAVKTADTEQELGILNEILEKEQLKQEHKLKILDVGSGTGRITIPLGEHYEMTGLDANQHFLGQANKRAEGKVTFKQGDIIDYQDSVETEQYDAVTYTWHSFLEAYGVGNTLKTLTSAWLALRPGGILIFDMPTRENPGMEDGYYTYEEEEGPGYMAYLMEEDEDNDELSFTLRMAGFVLEEKRDWDTATGMKKWTIVARKPEQVTMEDFEDEDMSEVA